MRWRANQINAVLMRSRWTPAFASATKDVNFVPDVNVPRWTRESKRLRRLPRGRQRNLKSLPCHLLGKEGRDGSTSQCGRGGSGVPETRIA